MIVGYRNNSYSYRRNIIDILHDTSYKKVRDIFYLLNAFGFFIKRATRNKVSVDDRNFAYNFIDFKFRKDTILHFFNTISFGRTPWITTFETVLPRYKSLAASHFGLNPNFSKVKHDAGIQKALSAISSARCKCIIAMSNCNADMQRELLRNFPEYKESIERKLRVMHPPQRSLVSEYLDKDVSLEGKIRFMFVGASFFRKGGVEIVETLDRLRKQNKYEIELTIVSSLSIDNYATNEGPDDVIKARHLIERNYEWINYFPTLPNREVLRLMQQSHVGLLPTYADTYGYSVLEFQGSGCPVITTNVRALPEINDNNSGWLIEVPRNYLGEGIYATKEDRLLMGDLIRNGLEKAVHEIFFDRTMIPKKANEAIARIKAKHSLDSYAKRMRKIYLEAMKDTCPSSSELPRWR
jgi:glycosyltransferase involved in cell wall biosynthesis